MNQVPGALTNPAYITLCLIAGVIGYQLAFASGQLFREGLFQFMTSFSLPLYAIVGAQKGVNVGLPVAGVLALAVIAPTAGRWYVDVSSGVPPKQFIRGEWFVTSRSSPGSSGCCATRPGSTRGGAPAISFVIGYTLRVLALYRGWEEPLAKEPKGVYVHDDGRPLLGRKLKGKSKREMDYLGLATGTSSRRERVLRSGFRAVMRRNCDARGNRNSPADACRDTGWVLRDGRRVGLGVPR